MPAALVTRSWRPGQWTPGGVVRLRAPGVYNRLQLRAGSRAQVQAWVPGRKRHRCPGLRFC